MAQWGEKWYGRPPKPQHDGRTHTCTWAKGAWLIMPRQQHDVLVVSSEGYRWT